MGKPDVNKICCQIIVFTIPLLFLLPSWITAASVALTIYLLVAATNSIRDGEIAVEQQLALQQEKNNKRSRKPR
jgi:hypothetical protein